MRKYIYLNNTSSVEIEKVAGDEIRVFIDGKEHEFEELNPNKLEYALATKRKKYINFLNNQFENLLILTGAGTSKTIGNNVKKGKLLSELWDDAEPVIILTSSSASKDVYESYKNHANCYVVKPHDFSQLSQTIKEIEKFWFGLTTLPSNGL